MKIILHFPLFIELSLIRSDFLYFLKYNNDSSIFDDKNTNKTPENMTIYHKSKLLTNCLKTVAFMYSKKAWRGTKNEH
jgi:hypothetical protein